MKRKILSFILSAVIALSALPCSVFASGEIIGDGGGGTLGGGTYENGWQSGSGGKAAEAVRVSVVDLDTKTTVGNVVDFTNVKFNGDMYVTTQITWSSNIKNKLYYLNGGTFTRVKEQYSYHNPTTPMPRVILDSTGAADIEELKDYFRSEDVLGEVAEKCGIAFDYLISGRYAILLEPVAYFNFQGVGYALSATEVAVYNQLLANNGLTTLRSKLVSVSHNALPLSMFLDETKTIYTGSATYEVVSRLGLKVWTGSTIANVDDTTIKSSLGNMLVVFPQTGGGSTPEDNNEAPDDPNAPPADGPALNGNDYVYNTSSDVISSVYVSSGSSDINSSYPLTVIFKLSGDGGFVKNITVPDVVLPKNEQQIVWIKWTTPSTPQNVTIDVALSQPGKATLSKSEIHAAVIDPKEVLPPDPEATDTKPAGWSNPSPGTSYNNFGTSAKHEWSVWVCEAHQVEVLDTSGSSGTVTYPNTQAYQHDSTCLQCRGNRISAYHNKITFKTKWETYYVFPEKSTYALTLSGNFEVTADDIERCPTQYQDWYNGARRYFIKAGYGIRVDLDTTLTPEGSCTANDYGYTVCASTTFPEFNYSTYNRLLESNGGSMTFKENLYSHWYNRVHFTPVWYPDEQYRVKCDISSVWTPMGELKLTLSDYVMINGTVFDDWYVALEE